MSSRSEAVSILDFLAAAFLPISGNASGTTPKISGWIHLGYVESIALTLATASATNVVWTASVAPSKPGQPSAVDAVDAIPLDPSYLSAAFPTGTNQNTTLTITMPPNYQWLQLTATPSAGSGAVTATPGLIIGRPAWINRTRNIGVVFDCPASATLAGQVAIEYSPNVNNLKHGLPNLPESSVAEPAIWVPATDVTDTAYTFPALSASTGQTVAIRFGQLEFIAIRAKLTPSAGFGRYRVVLNEKG